MESGTPSVFRASATASSFCGLANEKSNEIAMDCGLLRRSVRPGDSQFFGDGCGQDFSVAGGAFVRRRSADLSGPAARCDRRKNRRAWDGPGVRSRWRLRSPRWLIAQNRLRSIEGVIAFRAEFFAFWIGARGGGNGGRTEDSERPSTPIEERRGGRGLAGRRRGDGPASSNRSIGPLHPSGPSRGLQAFARPSVCASPRPSHLARVGAGPRLDLQRRVSAHLRRKTPPVHGAELQRMLDLGLAGGGERL